jgi:hypothetical protein
MVRRSFNFGHRREFFAGDAPYYEVYRDPEFLTALKITGVAEVHKRVEDLKGIQGAQVAYIARINTESVIDLY